MPGHRDSALRRIAGVSAGIVLGAGGAVAALVVVGDAASRSDGSSAVGVDLIRFAYGPAVILGSFLGAVLGRRHLARPLRTPWTRRPAGTFLKHYPVAMLGGVIVGAASSVFTIPAARFVLETLEFYGDMITPRIVRTTALLMYAAVLLGMLSVARWIVHALDRDIHARRRRSGRIRQELVAPLSRASNARAVPTRG